MEIIARAETNIGRKKRSNEDTFMIDRASRLFIVADGMGGHAAGEVASAQAAESAQRVISEGLAQLAQGDSEQVRAQILRLIEKAVRQAGRDIHAMAEADISKRGMGTTVSLLLLTPERGYIAHVGDSRVYLVRQGEVFQLTEDHSLIRELIKNKKLTPEEAESSPYRNALTRAVGVYADVEVDVLDFEVADHDRFLICSDGLSNYFESDQEVNEILSSHALDEAPSRFVEIANARGGKDNITCLLVEIESRGAHADDIAFRLNILRKMPIFQHLSYVELIEILNTCEQRRYAAGDEIFSEGVKGDEMFVILDGEVGIYKRSQLVIKIAQGGHFGEMALMDRNPRSAGARAETELRLIVVKRRPLFKLMQQNNEIAVKLLWCFMQVLTQRLRFTTDDLERYKREEPLHSVLNLD